MIDAQGIAQILGGLVLAGWLYWLTARVQLLLNHAEVIVDRDHTMPAQLPEVAAHIAAVEVATQPYVDRDADTGPIPLIPPTVLAWDTGAADEWERQQDAAFRDALAAIEAISVASPAPPAPTAAPQ